MPLAIFSFYLFPIATSNQALNIQSSTISDVFLTSQSDLESFFLAIPTIKPLTVAPITSHPNYCKNPLSAFHVPISVNIHILAGR